MKKFVQVCLVGLMLSFCETITAQQPVRGSAAVEQVNPALLEKSGDGDTEVVITITNKTRSRVDVLWVNERGEEEEFGTVEPGQTFEQDSFNSHLWRFKIGNDVIAKYRVGEAVKQKFEISLQSGSNRNATPNGWGASSNSKNTASRNPAPLPAASSSPVVIPPPAVIGSPLGSNLTEQEVENILQFHNDARTEVGVEEVVWSNQLAKYAQEWADHLAATGKFEHRPASGRFTQRYGENIAMSKSIDGCIEQWYAEKAEFDPEEPIPANIASFSAGHYSQMVWRKTTEIGAAKAIVKEGPHKGRIILVCNYKTAGNYAGEKAY